MPIRAENRSRYPKNWPDISHSIRHRANWRCEDCGVPNGELGGRDAGGKWHRALTLGCNGALPAAGSWGWCDGHHHQMRIVRIVLTVAHLDHQPENCDPANLRCWCQRCHNRYDAKTRAAGIKKRARAALAIQDLFAA